MRKGARLAWFHGLAHVSKSKLFISILINAIALKPPLRCSSALTRSIDLTVYDFTGPV